MIYVQCVLPVAPIRKIADHRSEMTSQFLFGETAEIMEENAEGWAYIKCTWDGYYGWVRLNQFAKSGRLAKAEEYATDWVNEIIHNKNKMMVPFGSSLYAGNLPRALPISQGNIKEDDFKKIAFTFLNTAYCWGGRSVFGIDCSGFAQLVFKLAAISLFRDAHMQAQQGTLIDALHKSTCGDLAFFDEPPGIISHVGILLSPTEIIHASGQVRIDSIDTNGIIHSTTGQRTHKLYSIKRIIDFEKVY
ncbi:MAG: NlpC/P60 family protein [Ferruginibacter sp.]